MNYLLEIKKFYDRQLSDHLSAGQIALWHALMEVSNRNGWQEWFTAPVETLKLLSGLSRTGVVSGIKRLIELGYIKKSNERYQLSTLQSQPEDLYINNKTKLNETKLNKEKEVPENGKAEFYGQAPVPLPGGVKL